MQTAKPIPSKCCLAPDMCRRGDIVKQRWQVMDKLGAGTFGQVYKVLDLDTQRHWALKVESLKARKPVLRMDVAIAKAMTGKTHAAEFFACGHEENFSFMVTQLLGKNLANRKRGSQEGKFPLKTVVRIGIQTVRALRDLHNSGFVHRDVKPSNMATGINDRDRYVYLIDFGLARKYLDDKGRIFPPRPKANFRGTVRYASLKAHMQQELSRGDDLWSLLYSLVDLYVGRLPWHNHRDMKRVGKEKMKHTPESLLRGLPKAWHLVYSVCKELTHDVVPAYEFLERALNGVMDERSTAIIDINDLTKAKWEWDVPHEEISEPTV